uniref:Uncharacterized protein n=1 Tax=Strigamia maritima TaxID=126957 RepID=T1J1R8_STRMM
MSEEHKRDEDPLMGHWITNWEQECIAELESEPDLQQEIQTEKDLATQKLWLLFQNTATALAQMYKDRQQGVSLWVPFQLAAGTVTNMYKESLDTQRRSAELGIQCGYQHRTRDVLAWAKKRRRTIRREELMAFLAGKTTPPRSRASPRPRIVLERANTRLPVSDAALVHNPEGDLNTFREAIALSSLSGAMSNISVGYRPHTPGSPTLGARRRNGLAELNAFICDEFARHCDPRKRSASSSDPLMDSPNHKRSRLT